MRIGHLGLYIIILLIVISHFSACRFGVLPPTMGLQKQPGFIQDVVTHSKFTQRTNARPVPAVVVQRPIRGIGFVRPEDSGSPIEQRPQAVEFYLNEDEVFEPYLILVNNASEPILFLVTTVLDYRQVSFELDGMWGLLHQVEVPANTELEIPFKLEIGSRGRHDVQVAAFEDPFNLTLDIDYRIDPFGYVIARRAVVVVGGDQHPARQLAVLDIGQMPADEAPVRFSVMLVKSADAGIDTVLPSERQFLYADSAQPGQLYSFALVVNNTGDRATNYAVIPFLDYHQVTLNGKDVFAIRVEPNEEAVLSLDLMLPKQQGIHQLQMLWLFNPYADLLRDESTSPFVKGSARVALDVRYKRD